MLELSESEERDVKEKKEDAQTGTNPQPDGSTVEEPPEDDKEPGSDREEQRAGKSCRCIQAELTSLAVFLLQ